MGFVSRNLPKCSINGTVACASMGPKTQLSFVGSGLRTCSSSGTVAHAIMGSRTWLSLVREYQLALEEGYIEVAKWVKKHSCPCIDTDMDIEMAKGHTSKE